MIIYTEFQKWKKMAEIKEENVLTKLQYIGNKRYIVDIFDSAIKQLRFDGTYRITMIIEKTDD